MAPPDVASKQIFKDVAFYDSCCALDESHRKLLQSGGATEVEEVSGQNIDWDEITHVFTRDFDFPEKESVISIPSVAIVTVCTAISLNTND